jgi:hypothetical protein
MNYLLCERMKEIFLMKGEKSRMREMKRKVVDLDCYFHDEPMMSRLLRRSESHLCA